jgi:hypothetical protein
MSKSLPIIILSVVLVSFFTGFVGYSVGKSTQSSSSSSSNSSLSSSMSKASSIASSMSDVMSKSMSSSDAMNSMSSSSSATLWKNTKYDGFTFETADWKILTDDDITPGDPNKSSTLVHETVLQKNDAFLSINIFNDLSQGPNVLCLEYDNNKGNLTKLNDKVYRAKYSFEGPVHTSYLPKDKLSFNKPLFVEQVYGGSGKYECTEGTEAASNLSPIIMTNGKYSFAAAIYAPGMYPPNNYKGAKELQDPSIADELFKSIKY